MSKSPICQPLFSIQKGPLGSGVCGYFATPPIINFANLASGMLSLTSPVSTEFNQASAKYLMASFLLTLFHPMLNRVNLDQVYIHLIFCSLCSPLVWNTISLDSWFSLARACLTIASQIVLANFSPTGL